MQGERIADGELPVRAGQYSKQRVMKNEDDEVIMWFMKSPIGGPAFQIGPKPIGGGHEIDEHEDGTISVVPKPGNSNSILVSWGHGGHWHGYIRRGVWEVLDSSPFGGNS